MTAATYADILVPETAASRPRLFTPALVAVCGAAVAGLTSFYLLLSVVPGYVVAAGAAEGAAGLVTGVLMLAGVLAECAAPRLLARFGSRTVFAAGLLLMGLPALLLVPSGQLAAVVAVCAVRGVGFGLTVVVAGALVVSLVPADRRGEGLASYGVAACIPGVVALPLGVWLADAVGYPAVFAAAAAAAVLGLASLARLPGPDAEAGNPDMEAGRPAPSAEPGPGLLRTAREPGQWRPAVVFAATTTAAGIVVAFLPLAAGLSGPAAAAGLLVQAVAATAGRYWAGRHGDRRGHARLVAPGLAVAAVGMVALLGLPDPRMAILAMAVFGLGFGVTQSATFAVMVERAPASGHGTVSALWNLAYDLGYGTGPLVFGVVLAGVGYQAGIVLTGVVMLTALVPAWRDLTARTGLRHVRAAAGRAPLRPRRALRRAGPARAGGHPLAGERAGHHLAGVVQERAVPAEHRWLRALPQHRAPGALPPRRPLGRPLRRPGAGPAAGLLPGRRPRLRRAPAALHRPGRPAQDPSTVELRAVDEQDELHQRRRGGGGRPPAAGRADPLRRAAPGRAVDPDPARRRPRLLPGPFADPEPFLARLRKDGFRSASGRSRTSARPAPRTSPGWPPVPSPPARTASLT